MKIGLYELPTDEKVVLLKTTQRGNVFMPAKEFTTVITLCKLVVDYFNMFGEDYIWASNQSIDLIGLPIRCYYKERQRLRELIKSAGEDLIPKLMDAMSQHLPEGYSLSLDLLLSAIPSEELVPTVPPLIPPMTEISAPSGIKYFLDLRNPTKLEVDYPEEVPRLFGLFGGRLGTKIVVRCLTIPVNIEEETLSGQKAVRLYQE